MNPAEMLKKYWIPAAAVAIVLAVLFAALHLSRGHWWGELDGDTLRTQVDRTLHGQVAGPLDTDPESPPVEPWFSLEQRFDPLCDPRSNFGRRGQGGGKVDFESRPAGKEYEDGSYSIPVYLACTVRHARLEDPMTIRFYLGTTDVTIEGGELIDASPSDDRFVSAEEQERVAASIAMVRRVLDGLPEQDGGDTVRYTFLDAGLCRSPQLDLLSESLRSPFSSMGENFSNWLMIAVETSSKHDGVEFGDHDYSLMAAKGINAPHLMECNRDACHLCMLQVPTGMFDEAPYRPRKILKVVYDFATAQASTIGKAEFLSPWADADVLNGLAVNGYPLVPQMAFPVFLVLGGLVIGMLLVLSLILGILLKFRQILFGVNNGSTVRIERPSKE